MPEIPSDDPVAIDHVRRLLADEIDMRSLSSVDWVRLIPVVVWLLERLFQALGTREIDDQANQDSNQPAG